MRRLWIAFAILAAVFAATWSNTLYLKALTEELTDLLTQAEVFGEAGDWDKALELTRQAESRWQEHALYLHTTLRHSDTDEIFLSFQEVAEFLHCQEGGEYSAANAVLIGRLDLLYEQEEFNLKNLL